MGVRGLAIARFVASIAIVSRFASEEGIRAVATACNTVADIRCMVVLPLEVVIIDEHDDDDDDTGI